MRLHRVNEVNADTEGGVSTSVRMFCLHN